MRTVATVFGLLCAFAPVARGEGAPQGLIRSARSGAWSAPATWEGGQVPGAGARVQVRTGHTVTYDVASDQVVRSVHVAGTLTFARDRSTRLAVGLIKVQPGDDAGEDGFNCDAHLPPPAPARPLPALEVGTADRPIPPEHTAIIRLVAVEGQDPTTCPAIVCCGGRMDFHGAPLSRTWVKLGATVNAGRGGKAPAAATPGDVEVRLAEPVTGWRVGDRVLVTTTSSRSRVNQRISLRHGPGYTEERTIRAIQGDRLTLDRPLDYHHQGEGDYRGEVANLSRNVVVESADPAKGRGHTMYHRGSAGSIGYAEFRHLGKEGVLGKYPIHFHLAGETMRGSSVVGASVWDSGNRWVAVHGTNYLVVRDCVGYRCVGHGFFLEDGTEVYNVFDRNLALQALTGKPLPEQALPFDHNDGAGFWWANSLNSFTRNVAAECDRYGFRFEATPTPDFDLRLPVLRPDGSRERVDVRTLPFVRFEGNEAHDQLFGVNLGGLGGNFFADGVRGVVPHGGQPFRLRDTRVWNTHWAFAAYTRYAVDGLDIADSTYGVFLPAYDMVALGPEKRPGPGSAWGRLTVNRTDVPIRLPTAGPSYFGEPFDLMEFAGDTLPPATVITHVERTGDGAVVVRGTTAEDGTVARVVVNGRPAKATAPNFAEWEVTLSELPGGELSAHAVDAAGNVEPQPHRLVLGAGGSRLVPGGVAPAAAVAADVPAKGEAPADAGSLQGTWVVVTQQRAGRPTERPKDMRWVIDGDTIWFDFGRKEVQALGGKQPAAGAGGKSVKPERARVGLPMRYQVDATASPGRIDVEGPKKSSHFGIYRLAGDELVVCLGVSMPSRTFQPEKAASNPETMRPTAFSPEAGAVLVLKRVKE
jgi:uncharacterized protein (TIGR03067 family)